MSDRFISPEPLPTAFEDEILKNLIEEASEVIQRATKMQRFGVNEIEPGQPFTNAQRLSLEVGDFLQVLDLAIDNHLATWMAIGEGRKRKATKLLKYMQHQKPGSNSPPDILPENAYSLWLDLVGQYRVALRDRDLRRQVELDAKISDIERRFPDEIEGLAPAK